MITDTYHIGAALLFAGAFAGLNAFLAYKQGKRDGIEAGYTSGLEHGRAKGWLEYYDTEQARDKARRDRIGRFRAKGVK